MVKRLCSLQSQRKNYNTQGYCGPYERRIRIPKVEQSIEKITFIKNIAIVMGKELPQPANASLNQRE